MKRLLALALALPLALALAPGCSSTAATPNKVCTAGNNVFCRCADRSEGTKLCNDQGTGYATACRLGENQPCPGGEVIPSEDGGLPPLAGIDTCPGNKISLGEGTKVFSGDTGPAKDDYKGDPGACASGDGAADDVYQITPSATGKLDIEVVPEPGYDAVIYVRDAPCAADSKQLKCGNSGKDGVREVISGLGVVTGKQYYLFVDGAAGGTSKGKYVLTFNLKAGPFCGDGQITAGEACDDGSPEANGDGCTSGCTSIDGNPPEGNKCPGQPVHLWPGVGARAAGTGSTDPAKNTGATNNWENTGSSCDVSASKLNVSEDHIYAVTPHGAGTVTVRVTQATFNAQIVMRTDCAVPASQPGNAACANNTTAVPDNETLTFAVAKDKTYYVAVDGILGQKGNYSISFQLQ